MTHWKWDVPTKFRGMKIPASRHGHGSFTEKKPIEDSGLAFDESLGVFLPETVIKERRRVKIGFGAGEDEK